MSNLGDAFKLALLLAAIGTIIAVSVLPSVAYQINEVNKLESIRC